MEFADEPVAPEPLAGRADERGLTAELTAFGLVGGSGAAAFVLLSSALVGVWGGLPNWLVSSICYGVLIGPVYLAHRRFSFRSSAPHGRALPRYAGVQLCSLALASLFSFVTYSLLALPTLWSSLVVTGLTSGVSFVVLRLWTFAAAGGSLSHQIPTTATIDSQFNRAPCE
jgi:putative flippase GtrA